MTLLSKWVTTILFVKLNSVYIINFIIVGVILLIQMFMQSLAFHVMTNLDCLLLDFQKWITSSFLTRITRFLAYNDCLKFGECGDAFGFQFWRVYDNVLYFWSWVFIMLYMSEVECRIGCLVFTHILMSYWMNI